MGDKMSPISKTLGALYKSLKDRLSAGGIETPEMDARLLISYALGVAPDDVILKPEREVPDHHEVLESFIARRLKHEPVSKIVGVRDFYGLSFDVNEHVLDPRADTEVLVDAARHFIETLDKDRVRILDLCTGTGCIAAALLSVFPKVTAVAVDISEDALNVARANFRKLGLEDRVTIIQSDLLEEVRGQFDVIVSNPPYIQTAVIATLDDDVRLYDPHLALDGGGDGLSVYGIVFPQIRNYMAKGAAAFFEIGYDQEEPIRKLAEYNGLQAVDVLRDLGGHPRVAVLR